MKTFCIKSPDKAIQQDIQAKIDNLNKPKGSLGRLCHAGLSYPADINSFFGSSLSSSAWW